jgi:hypothetical protein
MEEPMREETLTESEEMDVLDESDLAGLSEYSATGGGGQPLHMPVLDHLPHAHVDEPDVPDATDFRELYRYSLGRATQNALPDQEEDDWLEGGPLYVQERSRKTPKKKS